MRRKRRKKRAGPGFWGLLFGRAVTPETLKENSKKSFLDLDRDGHVKHTNITHVSVG